jgi:hypothetical protein
MTTDLPDAGGLGPLVGSWTVEALDFRLIYRRTG